mgnify:CR=1 FL=1
MKSFFINQYRVDMLRSQIIDQNDIQAMEPRVLKVLLLLAENQDQVVTHQEILDTVWPDMVVAPNAIQRCIVQLRKALNDDAKNQHVIVTHPKIGYRLVAKVDIEENNIDQESIKSRTAQKWMLWSISAAMLVLFVTIGSIVFLDGKSRKPAFTKLRPLTATDQKEFYPSFSPKGDYVLFNRFHQGCASQIWAKELATNREFLLTKNIDNYGQAALSPDGSQIAFTRSSSCASETKIPLCREVHVMSFNLALTAPQESQALLTCGEVSYSAVNWLNNKELAFIARTPESASVLRHTLNNGEQSILFENYELSLSALSYSNKNQELAITLSDQQNEHTLALLELTSGKIKEVPFDVPETFINQPWWDPIWHPNGETLLVSARSSIFELSRTGEFTQYQIPTALDIYNPSFHPTEDKIVASMGIVDLDVGEFSIDKNQANDVKLKQQTLRSTMEEFAAKYQPKTSNIAFISHRTGIPQVWFKQNQGLKQISDFVHYTHLSSITWSPEGNALLAVGDGKLHLVSLDHESKTLNTPFYVHDVYQWDNNSTLLAVTENNVKKLVRYDLTNENTETMFIGNVKWAHETKQYGLLLINQNGQLSQLFPTKLPKTPHLLESLDQFQINGKFVYRDGTLYAYNKKNELFSFEMASQTIHFLPSPEVNQDYLEIEDVSPQQSTLLFSFIQGSRKELVIFE